MVAIEDVLKKYEREYFELLEKCVQINSFTYNPKGIDAMGQYYGDLYETLGFQTHFVASTVENCGHHAISIKKGRSPKNIILVSHIDTVYPEEVEKKENHVWKAKGNIIYGPGTVDIKGGSVMIYLFLKALKLEQPELFEAFTWKILHNATEEIGATEFKLVARKYIDENSLVCLVYEGSCHNRESLEPVLLRSRKGCLRFELEAQGRAAHSSVLQKGASAIREMARLVEKIESMTDIERGLTFSVGLIEGGTAVNTVPDLCKCRLDIRAQTVAAYEKAKSDILHLAGEGSVKSLVGDWACKIKSRLVGAYPTWPSVAEHDWLVSLISEACSEGGRHLHIKEMGAGASDGNNVWEWIPVVDMLGPVGGNHHCPTNIPAEGKEPEFIAKDAILPQAAMNIRIIQKLAKRFSVHL